MTPNSVPYLGFLAVAVTLFWLLPVRYRRTFVLLASLGFYATWGVALVAVPLSVTVLVYVLTGLIARDSSRARRWVILGVTCTLSLLAFFKYRNFALVNLNAVLVWFHAGPVSFARNFALPLGISFYTFEAIAYMIDVRQGRVRRPGFLDLCLFFMFWPNLHEPRVRQSRPGFLGALEHPVPHQVHAMHGAPHHESPSRTMPQSN